MFFLSRCADSTGLQAGRTRLVLISLGCLHGTTLIVGVVHRGRMSSILVPQHAVWSFWRSWQRPQRLVCHRCLRCTRAFHKPWRQSCSEPRPSLFIGCLLHVDSNSMHATSNIPALHPSQCFTILRKHWQTMRHILHEQEFDESSMLLYARTGDAHLHAG